MTERHPRGPRDEDERQMLPSRRRSKLPVVGAFLAGIVAAPIAGSAIKPLVRGTVKTAVGISLQIRKLAAEVAADLQDLAAEASAEFAADEAGAPPVAPVSAPNAPKKKFNTAASASSASRKA